MEHLKERVAYLKGLAEGLKIDEKSNEGKLLKEIISVLDDFADSIVELDEVQEEIAEFVEEMDEDLSELEEDFYEEDEEEESEFYEIECPICHEIVVVDEESFVKDTTIVCPNCNNQIEVDFECECDCDCGCEHEGK